MSIDIVPAVLVQYLQYLSDEGTPSTVLGENILVSVLLQLVRSALLGRDSGRSRIPFTFTDKEEVFRVESAQKGSAYWAGGQAGSQGWLGLVGESW